MSLLELNEGAPQARPKSLSASSLWRRAVFGLVVLFVGTFASAWLYDATIKANASTPSAELAPAGSRTAQQPLLADPITALRSRAPLER